MHTHLLAAEANAVANNPSKDSVRAMHGIRNRLTTFRINCVFYSKVKKSCRVWEQRRFFMDRSILAVTVCCVPCSDNLPTIVDYSNLKWFYIEISLQNGPITCSQWLSRPVDRRDLESKCYCFHEKKLKSTCMVAWKPVNQRAPICI